MSTKFKPCLIYVDDLANNLEATKDSLSIDFDVHTFQTPQEALKKIVELKPMVILSDMKMPLMNGVEFLELSQQLYPSAKRVIITGNSDENLVIEAIKRASIYDFLRKPMKVGELEKAMLKAKEAYLEDEAKERMRKKALTPDLMEHPSWLHKISDQLREAFRALPQYQITDKDIEDWSILIHLAMSAEKRYYHNTEHLFDVWEDLSEPYERLAVLFHDVVYAQIDKNSVRGMLPKILTILGPMAPTHELKLVIPPGHQFQDQKDVEILYKVFGVKPGDVLHPMNGMNELLSARVAQRTLRPVLSAWDVVQVISCIELTIPFRGRDDQGRNAPERLYDRLLQLDSKIDTGPREENAKKAVRRAIDVSNRDLWGFSAINPAAFLNGSWKLLLEGNVPLQQELHTPTEYREALEKMEGFFSFLKEELIFQNFEDFPSHEEYAVLLKQCHINLDAGRTYFQAKILAMGILEALDELTGGGAPVEVFRGDIPSETNLNTNTIEQFLPKDIPIVLKSELNQTVVELLRVRADASMKYDLKNSPLAIFIYTRLTRGEFAALLAEARKYFKRTTNALSLIKAVPTQIRTAIFDATIKIAGSRANSIRTIRKLFESAGSGKEGERQLGELARQVAHDIRSPLAALTVAAEHSKELQEGDRDIITSATGRIRDIANDLIFKTKSKDKASPQEHTQPSVQLLSGLVEGIISEKRTEYRHLLDVEIDFVQNAKAYGVFASVVAGDLKRIISNLVNNSVEALVQKGKILISIQTEAESARIDVCDNGPGIPKEVLKNLGKKGVTFGKSGGSGLGLFHAVETVRTWKGSLSLSNLSTGGALATLLVPLASSPKWFVPALKVEKNMKIVIVDDDPTIHQIWTGRFEPMRKDLSVSLNHFSGKDDFSAWWSQEGRNGTAVVFLVDYEFLGKPYTGLDLIHEFCIADKSVLVTSRFEDPDVVKQCEAMGVRLIPKGLAGFVPVEIGRGETRLK
jgi:signal transduction histidine kinase/FixJ family two-component response regulator